MFFFKNYANNKAGRLVPDLFAFCFFKEAPHGIKAKGLQVSYFDSPQLGVQ